MASERTIIYAVDVPEDERLRSCPYTPSRYEIESDPGASGGIMVYGIHPTTLGTPPPRAANPSTRWLIGHLIGELLFRSDLDKTG